MKSFLNNNFLMIIKLLLVPMLSVANRFKRLFVYNNYDSSAYWKKRASDPGQAAVLWKNQEYNQLYRKIQQSILKRHVERLKVGDRILDIGCGIGVVIEMFLVLNPDVVIDAVDFEEMVTIAKSRIDTDSVRFFVGSAESYLAPNETYDLILSSGCYSAIRNIDNLEKGLSNGIAMLKTGGFMLMIDPFHRWNYLARAKYSSNDVVQFMKKHKLELKEKSGVLFWPFREWLANSNYSGDYLEKRFWLGERLLTILGQHFWADYKVLVFRKLP